MPQKYLSVDPNAGLEAEGQGERQYLSTDPNAGQDSPESPGQGTSVNRGGGSILTPGLTTGAAMKAVPAIVAGVHQGAKALGKVAAKTASAGRYAPAVVAVDALNDVVDGRPGAATTKVAGAAAMAKGVPAIVHAAERITRPTSGVTRGAAGRFVPGAATPLRRAAGALSRAAGPVGLAVETIFGDGAAGHASVDPNETTLERQARFQREYDALIAAKRNAPPGSPTWDRLQTRLGELMTLLGHVRTRR